MKFVLTWLTCSSVEEGRFATKDILRNFNLNSIGRLIGWADSFLMIQFNNAVSQNSLPSVRPGCVLLGWFAGISDRGIDDVSAVIYYLDCIVRMAGGYLVLGR